MALNEVLLNMLLKVVVRTRTLRRDRTARLKVKLCLQSEPSYVCNTVQAGLQAISCEAFTHDTSCARYLQTSCYQLAERYVSGPAWLEVRLLSLHA